jgi:hypothetical protein
MHYPVIYPEGLMKTMRTFSQYSHNPAEIRTDHLPNIRVEFYYVDVALFRILS